MRFDPTRPGPPVDWSSLTPGGSYGETHSGRWEVRVNRADDDLEVAVQLVRTEPDAPLGRRAIAVGMTSGEAAEFGYWLLSAARTTARLNARRI